MAFYEHFPYTNFHDINLDWVIRTLKEQEETIKNFVSVSSIKYADPIQWNITSQYETNTIVIDPETGTAYISTQPVPAGVALSNTEYWTVVFDLQTIIDQMGVDIQSVRDELAQEVIDRQEADNELAAADDALMEEFNNVINAERKIAFLRNDAPEGLGDCIVIYGNKTIVVDFGRETDASTLRSFLKAKNLSKIDYIFITHYHLDHIGGENAAGLTAFLNDVYFDFTDCICWLPHNNISWSSFVDNDNYVPYITAQEASAKAALRAANITMVYPTEGMTVTISDTETMTFHNLSAAKFTNYYSYVLTSAMNEGQHTNYNNFSMIGIYKFIDQNFIITGDIEEPAESQNYQYLDRIDLYSVEHHGLNYNASQQWLNNLMGTYAVVGNNGAGGSETYQRTVVFNLLSKGVKVVATSENNDHVIMTMQRGTLTSEAAYLGNLQNPYITSYAGEAITDGADLDTYINPGVYYSVSSARTATLINVPKLNDEQIIFSGFRMFVFRINHSGTGVIQFIFPTSTKMTTMYFRSYLSDGFGIWKAWYPTETIYADTSARFLELFTLHDCTITKAHFFKKSGWCHLFADFTLTADASANKLLMDTPWSVARPPYTFSVYAVDYSTKENYRIFIGSTSEHYLQIYATSTIPSGTRMILEMDFPTHPQDERGSQ